jgi:hypothetical protein
LKKCKPSRTYEEALDNEREADRKAVQDNEDRVVEIDDVDMVEILSAALSPGLYKGQQHQLLTPKEGYASNLYLGSHRCEDGVGLGIAQLTGDGSFEGLFGIDFFGVGI